MSKRQSGECLWSCRRGATYLCSFSFFEFTHTVHIFFNLLKESLESKVWWFRLSHTSHYLCHSLRVFFSLTLKMALIQNSHTFNWIGSTRTYWTHLLFFLVLCSSAHHLFAKSSNCKIRLLIASTHLKGLLNFYSVRCYLLTTVTACLRCC